MSDERTPNRLAGQTSPYLLQHAYNPVDWYPWGDEALERARLEDRPILLSIGYAACHWCHVMEKESFEDAATAAIMNEHFVSIKVDREERPDLDSIYMDAVQAMTGSGGWPMTVFLTPEGAPFYAGTYFPKEDAHGMPAFARVLGGIAEAWRERRDAATEQGRHVLESIGRGSLLRQSNEPLVEDVLREACAGLHRSFDPEWGGLGGAPKFPQPMTLEFLLRCHLRGYDGALEMVTTTLDRMAAGGIYDHVGGGFHRYSTDARWHVPHFEKMLYDNALLARLYARAWKVSGNAPYARVAGETLGYLLREMRHPDGGFFSSQDADSEGKEGTYYVWSWDQLLDACRDIAAVGSTAEPDPSSRASDAAMRAIPAEAVARAFGAVPQGNWEGTNVLWRPRPLAEVAAEAGVDPEDLRCRMENERLALMRRRTGRVAPSTDDKVLAAWNGLAISALAECANALGDDGYVDAAVRAADFVLTNLRREDGRLLRSWRDGKAGGPGYLDDHAMMAEACLTLYQTTFDLRWFREARSLADDMLRLFRDEASGGFFQTGSDAEALVTRPKDVFDNAVPSGNSAAADVLLRLALLTGEEGYERAGVSALRLVHELMRRAPSGFGHALCALDLHLSGGQEVAIIGEPASGDTLRLVGEVRRRYLPNAVLAVSAPGDAGAAKAIALLRDRRAVNGRATAYVCRRFVCRLPVTNPEELAEQLLR